MPYFQKYSTMRDFLCGCIHASFSTWLIGYGRKRQKGERAMQYAIDALICARINDMCTLDEGVVWGIS